MITTLTDSSVDTAVRASIISLIIFDESELIFCGWFKVK